MATAGLILAAGSSSRLGQPKQLLLYHDESFIHRTVRLALSANLSPIHVVLGYSSSKVYAALEPLTSEITIVKNSTWNQGIGNSLSCGVRSLPSNVSAASVLIIDQPYLSDKVLKNILCRYRTGKFSIVASQYDNNSVGVPAIFSRTHFEELSALNGANGAKKLLVRHASTLSTISFSRGDTDVDTRADIRRLELGEPT